MHVLKALQMVEQVKKRYTSASLLLFNENAATTVPVDP